MRAAIVTAPGCRTPRGARAPIVAVAAGLQPRGWRVHVVLADDAWLRTLNRRFRRRDRATDVLSFQYEPTPGRDGGPDGEVYVSLERAAVQAAERRHTLRQEVVLLALHGLLHVQGHDHHRRRDRARMHAAEAAALQRLSRQWRAFAMTPLVSPPAVATPRRRGGRG